MTSQPPPPATPVTIIQTHTNHIEGGYDHEEGILSPPPTPISNQHRPSRFTSHSHSPLHASLIAHSNSHHSSITPIPDRCRAASPLRLSPQDELESEKPNLEESPPSNLATGNALEPQNHPIRRASSHHKPKPRNKSSALKNTSLLRVRKEEHPLRRLKASRYYPALVLENSGSTARDHLASERTFLAYVRTSLGLASMGVALVQLFTISGMAALADSVPVPAASKRVQQFAKPLGAMTIAFSLVVLAIGLWRYFKIQVSLTEGRFPTARLSIAFTGFIIGAIVTIIFGAVLSGRS